MIAGPSPAADFIFISAKEYSVKPSDKVDSGGEKNIITVVISVIIAIGVNLEYSPYQTFHLKFPYWGLF